MIMRTLTILLFAFVTLAPMSAVVAATTITPPGNTSTTITPPGNTGSSVKLVNPLGPGSTTLESFLKSILDFVIRLGAIIVVIMLVYVGFKFVSARGDPGELSKAKDMLLWTVIGALVLLGSQVLADGIQATVKAFR